MNRRHFFKPLIAGAAAGALPGPLFSNAYLYSDETRYDFAKRGKSQNWNPNTYGVAKLAEVNDAEAIWQKLLSRHSNIRFMLSGHVLNDGAARLASPGKDGRIVHQLLVMQFRGNHLPFHR